VSVAHGDHPEMGSPGDLRARKRGRRRRRSEMVGRADWTGSKGPPFKRPRSNRLRGFRPVRVRSS
jgi:hypothetical protein